MDEHNKPKKSVSMKGALSAVVFLVVVGATFFLGYGRLDWWEAWLLLGLWVLYFGGMLIVVRRVNPDVVEERSNSLERFSQKWDKIIILLYQVFSLCLYLVAGMDTGRYGWTGGLPDWLKWTAFGFVLGVYLLPFWAVMSNPFASGAVRIQKARDHHAINQGPYRYIRHPMYLGDMVFGIAFPLFLESIWALLPGIVIVFLFLLRTFLEDNYLMENLPGYQDYALQTRYRLLPGIW